MNIVSITRTADDKSTVRILDADGLESFANENHPIVQAFVDGGGKINDAPKPEVSVPESVSARQFKLQLLSAGLLDQVDAWIATQSKAVQIAYEYSGAFVRSEPMMAAGFAAMGFTDKQIDDFFKAASAL